MAYIDISHLLMVSQEVMLDVYVLRVVVFNRIIRQVDCTLIATLEWDFAQIVAKVLKGLPHPK
jgi:NADH:ubiquinone oxidoreductase subunit K